MNENWDSDVRADMSDALDRIVPEDKKGQGLYRHDAEGTDDMPVSVPAWHQIPTGGAWKSGERGSRNILGHIRGTWLMGECIKSRRRLTVDGR